jgi:hypothetical protein
MSHLVNELKLLFAQYFKNSEADMRTALAYKDALAGENEEKVILNIRMYRKNSTGRFPTVSDLIHGSQDQIELEWQAFKLRFISNMCNNLLYIEIPSDVYTMKKMVGEQRCDSSTKEELVWILKEVKEIFISKKMCGVDLCSLPDINSGKYIRVSSSAVMLEDPKNEEKDDGFSKISGLIDVKN